MLTLKDADLEVKMCAVVESGDGYVVMARGWLDTAGGVRGGGFRCR